MRICPPLQGALQLPWLSVFPALVVPQSSGPIGGHSMADPHAALSSAGNNHEAPLSLFPAAEQKISLWLFKTFY